MLSSVGRGAPPDMDDSIISDFVSQVSRVIAPKKEFARAPDVSPSGPPRAPEVGGPPRAPEVGGPPRTDGGAAGGRAPEGGAAGGRAPEGGAAGGKAPDAGGPTKTTNADGTPAPTSASGVKKEVTLESKRPKDESTDHSPDGKKKQTDDAEKEKSDWLSKVGGLGGLAMIGLTVGIATAIAAKTGEQFTACVNANISITKVAPSPRLPTWLAWLPEWDWIVKLFPLPKTVVITYTVDTSYTPLAKSDTWDITGTGTEIDKKAVPLEKVLKGKSIRIKCGSDDCSNVKSTQGSAQVNCDFADRLNQAVEDVSTDIASKLGKFAASAGSAFIQFLPLIILMVALYMGFSLFAK